jgi:hypothetical protein
MKKRHFALVTIAAMGTMIVPASADPLTIGVSVSAAVLGGSNVGSVIVAFAVSLVESTALPYLGAPLSWTDSEQ